MAAAPVHPLRRRGCRQVSRLIHEQGFICSHRLAAAFHSEAALLTASRARAHVHTHRPQTHLKFHSLSAFLIVILRRNMRWLVSVGHTEVITHWFLIGYLSHTQEGVIIKALYGFSHTFTEKYQVKQRKVKNCELVNKN